MPTTRFKKFILKIFGSALVPVFLFMPQAPAIAQDDNAQVAIDFKIADGTSEQSLLNQYNIQAHYLFPQTFSATVPYEILQKLKADPRIAYAEPDVRVKAFTIAANDPFFTTDASLEERQWYLEKTHVPEAWDYTKGSNTVIVAIVDTGIHATHIELNDGRVIEGYDAINSRIIQAGSNSDDNGHGTAVAGVIGAIPNNSRGIAGINWDIKLMPVKALQADGSGDLSAVASGIVWAVDHNANIINLSLGGTNFGSDRALSDAITYAYNHGALIVAAAGNDTADHGLNLDSSPVYPVCGDNGQDMVLGVAATDVNDQKASFSNYGASCIDISAPGKKIVTTAYLPSEDSNNILIYGSGTSLAAPMVSGIAALLKAKNPNFSNVDIKNIIKTTADDIYPLNQTSCNSTSCNGFLGKGRINAQRALIPVPVASGTLVREVLTGNIYIITDNSKRLISDFVFKQRGFNSNEIRSEAGIQLSNFATASPLPPIEGTLIKSANETQVYVIETELKRPLTYLVFTSRGYSFANVKTLPKTEVDSYALGEWYWPPDSTMVLISGNSTVYVMDQKVVRPVTLFVFKQRKLSFAKVIRVTVDEFSHIPKPQDPNWLAPLDGTLVKSATDPAIYVVENSLKRVLSYEAFVARGYKFANVKVLPQAEIDVIGNGFPLLTP
ncbi:MAG: S8 family peptidase [Candidatus Doudnabacteria bacterium]|nr:S8 family peptidase [Candidatus Doudnabacteria bacterium]